MLRSSKSFSDRGSVSPNLSPSNHSINSLIQSRSSASLSRQISTASMRRSLSSKDKLTWTFWTTRFWLLLLSFVIFWNFRTTIEPSDPGIQQLRSFAVSEHPQERYKRRPAMKPERMAELRGPDGPKYNVLVTGAAGFVGMFTAIELKRIGMTPIGYDNVNAYYSPALKELRIRELEKQDIKFVKGDVCDSDALRKTILENEITRVVHLAAQAGVRYSIDHPMEYTRNNVDCFVKLLEVMVEMGLHTDDTLIYASSSSVYGNNVNIPFRESDRLEDPASLYAATKRSDELIAQTYFNLYNMTSIGLRFFTVYGPFGRPDMAPWIFTQKISNNQTIRVFNHGESKRDFTYVEDIVQGVVNALFVKARQPELINLGNGRPIVLEDFVNLVEDQVGSKAIIDSVGMQKGDVPVTYADISKAGRMLAYRPSTPIEDGITQFVKWFRKHDASQFRMAY